MGKNAVRYITEKLHEYGVTVEKLESMFKRGNKHEEDIFVVFDIRYDKHMLQGKEQAVERPLVPWYGFLIEEGKAFLLVVNRNTGTL